MVYGVWCVIIDGIRRLQQLFAESWDSQIMVSVEREGEGGGGLKREEGRMETQRLIYY